MHTGFHVVAVLFLEFRALPFLASPLLSGHAFELVIGKTDKLRSAGA